MPRAHPALIAAALCGIAAPAADGQTAGTAQPTKLWAAQTTANQITLVWTVASGATGYVLYRGGNAAQGAQGQTKVATLAGNVTRYVFIVRSAGRAVQQFYLEATGASGGASQRVSFNPVTLASGAVPPVAPATLTAKESSPGVVTVTWTPAPGATAYLLGRAVGGSGLQTLCAFCSTATTFVDSAVTLGARHNYTVATITPSGVSARATSNQLTPGVTTVATDSGGTGGSGTPGDTTRTTTTTNPDPLNGRYRVTLTGFTVQAQSYDNPLQLDGTGDEVYLATHVMSFDTASSVLVVDNRVRTSRIYGDVNGFSYRVKAGNAGMTGGLRTGDSYPASKATGKGTASDVPMELWEGELVQGRSAVVLVPTVWEWDDKVELFGNWLTGRHALLLRLLQPDPIVAILTNRSPQPVEVGAGGLFVHTNMVGDARDRPIGLRPGQPAKGAGFYAPLPLDPKAGSATTTYLAKSTSVVGAILPASPLADVATSILRSAIGAAGGFSAALGGANANIPLATISSAAQALGAIAARLKPLVGEALRTQNVIGLGQILTVLAAANPSSLSQELYLFEKIVVLTPQAVGSARAQSKAATGSAVFIDVPYVDYSALQGKYVLHLKVERLP